jgi:hypothetical protein
MCDELTKALETVVDNELDLEGMLIQLDLLGADPVNSMVESLAKSLALKLRQRFRTDNAEEVRTEAALKRCANALARGWVTHVSLSKPYRQILLQLFGAFAETVALSDDGPLAQIHTEAWLLGAESVLEFSMGEKRKWFRANCYSLSKPLAEAVKMSCSALREDDEDAQLAQRLAAAGRIMFFLFDASQVLRSPRVTATDPTRLAIFLSANDADGLFMHCVECMSFSTLCSFLEWLRERCLGEQGGDLETLEDQPGLSWLERRLRNWPFFLLVNVCARLFRVPQNVADTAPNLAPITVDAVRKAAHENAEAVVKKYPRALPGTSDAEAEAKSASYAKLFGIASNEMPQLPPERAAEPPAGRVIATGSKRVVPDEKEAHGRDHKRDKRGRLDGVTSAPAAPSTDPSVHRTVVHKTVRQILIQKTTEPPSHLSSKPPKPLSPAPANTPTPTAPQQLPVQPQDPLEAQREVVLRRIADINSRFRTLLADEVARIARHRQPA